jgi:hypothetical protein
MREVNTLLRCYIRIALKTMIERQVKLVFAYNELIFALKALLSHGRGRVTRHHSKCKRVENINRIEKEEDKSLT